VSKGERDGCGHNGTMAGRGERAALPPVRVRRHRGDGQVGVHPSDHIGVGDAHGDGQGYEPPERVPSHVGGRSSRGRLRIGVDGQGIAVHVTDKRDVSTAQWRDEGLNLRHAPLFKGWWVSWRLGSFHTQRVQIISQ